MDHDLGFPGFLYASWIRHARNGHRTVQKCAKYSDVIVSFEIFTMNESGHILSLAKDGKFLFKINLNFLFKISLLILILKFD